MSKTQKYYAVRVGKTPGVYFTWEDCKKQVDGVKGAVYKSFTNILDAEKWVHSMKGNPSTASRSPVSPAGSVLASRLRREVATGNPQPFRGGNNATSGHAADYVIYTDGSCLRNPSGPGGWAVVARETATGKVTEKSDGAASTTNNRMELTAAIVALSLTPAGSRVELHTDSQYLINGITKWVPGWKRRGWKRASGEPVLNPDLWQQLETLDAARRVSWHWVKGHANIPLNERCDKLAKAAAARYA